MKTLKIINTGILFITAVLYITFYYGLLSQILLGAVQVISSLIIGRNLKKLDQKSQKRLKGYWLIISTYFACWFLPLKELLNNTMIPVIGFILIPMAIAIYFYLTLINIKKLEHEIK